MMQEGRRQQAAGRKQAAQSGSVFAAYCLLPAAYFLFFRISASPVGRALFAGALLISAYALVLYWRSLSARPRQVRFTLVGLRAATLLLMSLALSGLTIEYEGAARARVLLVSSLAASREAEGSKALGLDEAVTAQIARTLQAGGFEVASEKDSRSELSNDDERFSASVLVTDGAMSSLEARRAVLRLSERVGTAPVYVFADSRASAGASVALESVSVLGRAVRGVPVSVRCDVHARGMNGRESLITVSDDAKVQASARIAWTEDDERQSVVLTFVPKTTGWIDYNARVEASGDEKPSILARPFSLYVEERRLRILYFESEPTWEAKFIRRALEQSGLFEVDYFAQVSRASTIGMSEEAREQKEQDEGAAPQEDNKSGAATNAPTAKLHAVLQSAAQLNLYDCVMVGATENSLVSASEVANLNRWVERRGGGLIVLGGNGFNGSIVAPGGKLYSLLPAELSAQSFSTEAETVSQGRPLEAEKTRGNSLLTPTEAGANGALEGYLRAVEDAQAKPSMLTGQGLKLGSLRPGANILAVAGQPGVTGTSETGAALIAARRDGAGRALLFAPADSWRMHAGESGEEGQVGGTFAALWQGIVLWTSANARSAAEISLSDDSPAAGSVVTVEIKARDAISFSPQKIEKLNARLQSLTEETDDPSALAEMKEIAFAPDATDPSVWRARISAPSSGRYALDVDYVAGGKKGSVEKYFAVVTPVSEEAGAAFETLRRAARETGGDLITSAEMNSLAERLSMTSSSAQRGGRTFEMRAWWPLAFIIPLLLSAEWFARCFYRVD